MKKWTDKEAKSYLQEKNLNAGNFYWGKIPLSQWFNCVEVMTSGVHSHKSIADHCGCPVGRAIYMRNQIERKYKG